MNEIGAKMTISRRTSVKRQKSVYCVACQTVLITGGISAPLKAPELFGTPFSVTYSCKSRSVGSRDRCTGVLPILPSLYYTLLKS